MNKTLLITGVILGGLSVIIGAFGAHALKNHLSAESLVSFETGVRYQMYHALLMMVLSLIPVLGVQQKTVLFWLLLIGVLLFSGSIYLLSTTGLSGWNLKRLALLTPLGGTLLILSWAILAFHLVRIKF